MGKSSRNTTTGYQQLSQQGSNSGVELAESAGYGAIPNNTPATEVEAGFPSRRAPKIKPSAAQVAAYKQFAARSFFVILLGVIFVASILAGERPDALAKLAGKDNADHLTDGDKFKIVLALFGMTLAFWAAEMGVYTGYDFIVHPTVDTYRPLSNSADSAEITEGDSLEAREMGRDFLVPGNSQFVDPDSRLERGLEIEIDPALNVHSVTPVNPSVEHPYSISFASDVEENITEKATGESMDFVSQQSIVIKRGRPSQYKKRSSAEGVKATLTAGKTINYSDINDVSFNMLKARETANAKRIGKNPLKSWQEFYTSWQTDENKEQFDYWVDTARTLAEAIISGDVEGQVNHTIQLQVVALFLLEHGVNAFQRMEKSDSYTEEAAKEVILDVYFGGALVDQCIEKRQSVVGDIKTAFENSYPALSQHSVSIIQPAREAMVDKCRSASWSGIDATLEFFASKNPRSEPVTKAASDGEKAEPTSEEQQGAAIGKPQVELAAEAQGQQAEKGGAAGDAKQDEQNILQEVLVQTRLQQEKEGGEAEPGATDEQAVGAEKRTADQVEMTTEKTVLEASEAFAARFLASSEDEQEAEAPASALEAQDRRSKDESDELYVAEKQTKEEPKEAQDKNDSVVLGGGLFSLPVAQEGQKALASAALADSKDGQQGEYMEVEGGSGSEDDTRPTSS